MSDHHRPTAAYLSTLVNPADLRPDSHRSITHDGTRYTLVSADPETTRIEPLYEWEASHLWIVGPVTWTDHTKGLAHSDVMVLATILDDYTTLWAMSKEGMFAGYAEVR